MTSGRFTFGVATPSGRLSFVFRAGVLELRGPGRTPSGVPPPRLVSSKDGSDRPDRTPGTPSSVGGGGGAGDESSLFYDRRRTSLRGSPSPLVRTVVSCPGTRIATMSEGSPRSGLEGHEVTGVDLLSVPCSRRKIPGRVHGSQTRILHLAPPGDFSPLLTPDRVPELDPSVRPRYSSLGAPASGPEGEGEVYGKMSPPLSPERVRSVCLYLASRGTTETPGLGSGNSSEYVRDRPRSLLRPFRYITPG